MKIAIDVMGGDYAPKELVLGARSYIESGGKASLILVGNENSIKEFYPEPPSNCEIFHTDETIEMGESPLNALRKKRNASVAIAARLVKEGKAAAFISAGSTGAQMAASLLEIGRISGIDRPAISVMLPTNKEDQGALLLDVGANVDIRAKHLHQFAIMGSAYYEKICNIPNPTIGLLSIGEEEGKGNELTKAAYPLLKSDSNLNFIGNIEADSLYYGKAQVVVCDGFAGNIILKASESLSELIQTTMLTAASTAEIPLEQLMLLKQGLKKFNPDSEEYSSAPLLGLNGISMVCHGKAKAKVISNAISLAENCAKTAFVDLIKEKLTETKKE